MNAIIDLKEYENFKNDINFQIYKNNIKEYENHMIDKYVTDFSSLNKTLEFKRFVQVEFNSYNELEQLLKDENLKNVPVLAYGNKADLNNCLGPDEIIEKLEMNDITGRDWSLYACSALKGTGVKDGIKWILEKLSQ